jgi:integrase
MRACVMLRVNINRETRSPHKVAELVAHYMENELPNYTGYLKRWILPGWGEYSLSAVKAVAVEGWLKTLPLAPGTRAKLRNLMHAILNHAMRWEFFDRNPITLVRQSAKRIRVPEVLTPEEIGKLLSELPEVWRTAVYLAITTGLRVSELLGSKWADVGFPTGEIHLSRGVVRRFIGNMKTEASRKPVPREGKLADVLAHWREICPYDQNEDFIFASPKKHGKQPYWPSAAMEDHIQPAARRAGIQKRIGWHTLRHTFGTRFVDEPRNAVQQADDLVAAAMQRLADVFASERSSWNSSGVEATASQPRTYASHCNVIVLSFTGCFQFKPPRLNIASSMSRTATLGRAL